MKHGYFTGLLSLVCALNCLQAPAQSLARVANVNISTGATGLAAVGSTAYITAIRSGYFYLEAYNLTQPAAPVLLGSVKPYLPYPRAVVIGGTKAYVLGYGIAGPPSSYYLQAVEMSQPANPVAGTVADLGQFEPRIAASDKLVCVASRVVGTLSVYDANLTLLATVAANAANVVLNGTVAYVQRGSEVDIYNLAVATAPVRVASMYGSIGAVSGNLAFSLDNSTLSVYDVSNPLQPVLKGSVANNGGTLLAASGNRVYTTGLYAEIAGSTSQLQAFNVSNPAAPTLLATAAAGSTATALAANGNTAYLINNHVVQAYTLTGLLAATAPLTPATSPYPNPAHGTLNLGQVPANTPVLIYDATGRVCLQTTTKATTKLDISALPAGLYLARVGAAVHRLLVE